MADISRFDCASSSLMLKALLRKTKHIFWICLGLGSAIHLSLMQISGFEAEHKVVKPLTTQFVKRQPRLTKPLELKKYPQPKRRSIQRKMISVKAKMPRDQRGARLQPIQALKGLAKPSVEIGRIAAFGNVEIEPKSIAGIIEGTKEVEQKVDMSLELLDIDVLDTGQYHAMVVQYPEDKRVIRGFFHLAFTYSPSMRNRNWHQGEDRRFCAMRHLVEAMNKYTDIRTDLVGRYTFDDAELFKIPWIFIYGGHWGFALTESENRNLGAYLVKGGFILGDGGASLHKLGNSATRKMFRDALAIHGLSHGTHWTFERLPNHHPIYHCYFDFDNGPPIAGDYKNGKVDSWMHDPAPFDYLEGITIGGRLWAIMSNKGWGNAWGDWGGYSGHGYDWLDPTRALQFGINTIIFALTQEGSTTHRLMDSIK